LSALLAGEKYRNRLFVLYAFNYEITKIKYLVSEPMAGYIRIQWWRDSIADIYKNNLNKSNNDIINALDLVIKQTSVNQMLFENLLDAKDAEIDLQIFENLEQLKQNVLDNYFNLFKLLLASVGVNHGANDEESFNIILDGVVAFAITNIMRFAKYNAYHKKIVFPQDLMDEYKVTESQIYNGSNIEGIKKITKILYYEAQRYLIKYNQNCKQLSDLSLDVMLPVSLSSQYLKRIQKNDYDIFNYDLNIKPISLQLSLYKNKFFR
jgi:phytoene/squalene synthetase